MPTNKDFKRVVRARMTKTGESYTTARAQLLTKKATAASIPSDLAKLAGTSDATLKAKTGCTWDRWVWALDRVEAHDWEHREIAEYVHEKYKVPGWWSQTVTVGYERIKGLRAIGQRRGGGFEASKSRTFAVPLARLYRAFHDKRTRARWLPGVDLTIRVATRDKSMRITWPGKTSVELYFSSRGLKKSQVAVQHVKLPDKEAATRMKQYWEERLDTLGEMLTPAARRKKSVA
jgi:nucleotidyltransferase/DNA polymerase involved in DNA repair